MSKEKLNVILLIGLAISLPLLFFTKWGWVIAIPFLLFASLVQSSEKSERIFREKEKIKDEIEKETGKRPDDLTPEQCESWKLTH